MKHNPGNPLIKEAYQLPTTNHGGNPSKSSRYSMKMEIKRIFFKKKRMQYHGKDT